jgi:hypothetical protein
MYDSKGARVYQHGYVTTVSYEIMDVHAEFLSKGVYALILSDTEGNTLAKGKVLIQ